MRFSCLWLLCLLSCGGNEVSDLSELSDLIGRCIRLTQAIAVIDAGDLNEATPVYLSTASHTSSQAIRGNLQTGTIVHVVRVVRVRSFGITRIEIIVTTPARGDVAIGASQLFRDEWLDETLRRIRQGEFVSRRTLETSLDENLAHWCGE